MSLVAGGNWALEQLADVLDGAAKAQVGFEQGSGDHRGDVEVVDLLVQ